MNTIQNYRLMAFVRRAATLTGLFFVFLFSSVCCADNNHAVNGYNESSKNSQNSSLIESVKQSDAFKAANKFFSSKIGIAILVVILAILFGFINIGTIIKIAIVGLILLYLFIRFI